jgi:hypothetical protein
MVLKSRWLSLPPIGVVCAVTLNTSLWTIYSAFSGIVLRTVIRALHRLNTLGTKKAVPSVGARDGIEPMAQPVTPSTKGSRFSLLTERHSIPETAAGPYSSGGKHCSCTSSVAQMISPTAFDAIRRCVSPEGLALNSTQLGYTWK